MSKKEELRAQRINTIINGVSKYQEKDVNIALEAVKSYIKEEFNVILKHDKTIRLMDIISKLKLLYNDVHFTETFESSNMRPDGGILYLASLSGNYFPVLITEVKNQGTNDLRLKEGKSIQAMGNAIERLGKNVIGFRTFLLNEGIFPFICFGYGYDFNPSSSINDRVKTIAMFGELNEVNVVNFGKTGQFNRGSFFFRQSKWEIQEMVEIMIDIVEKSIYYYFAKYGKDFFIKNN